MTLCVYVYLVEFDVFVLDETYIVSPKLVYEHIWEKNVRARLHLGPIRGPKRNPIIGAQHFQEVAIDDPNDGKSIWKWPIDVSCQWINLS